MGKGPRRNGGRWNRPGVPLFYRSRSRALVALEVLVHLGKGLPFNRYLVEVPATDRMGWDAEPFGLVSLDWGTHWQKRR